MTLTFLLCKIVENKEAAMDFVRFATDTQRLAPSKLDTLRNARSSIPKIGTFHSDASIKMIDQCHTETARKCTPK